MWRSAKARKPIPFSAAVRERNLKEVRRQLDAGADPNGVYEGESVPPLFYAIHEGAEMVKLLIDAGAAPNARESGRRTPLHQAASCGYAEVAHILLAAGADVNALDDWGHTPLFATLEPTPSDMTYMIYPSERNPARARVQQEQAGKKSVAQLLYSYGAVPSPADEEVGEALGPVPEATRQELHMRLSYQGGDLAYRNAVRDVMIEYPTLHDALRLIRRKKDASDGEKVFLTRFEEYERRIRSASPWASGPGM